MEHKDITARYEAEYPVESEKWGTLNNDIATFEREAAIKAATYEREMQWKFMDWAADSGYVTVKGTEGRYWYFNSKAYTKQELFQIFLNENK